jgi:hypothetical protein
MGPDARVALGALRDLVARNFEEDEPGRGVEGPENAHG